MNDPHIEALIYRVVVRDVDTSDTECSRVNLPGFECEVDGEWLVARPRGHFPDLASARNALDPRLAAWEVDADVRLRVPLEFRFERAEVVDRDPSEVPVVESRLRITADAVVVVAGTPALPRIPDPPAPSFDENNLVYTLRRRLRDYREGRERLLACAQWCMTELQDRYGGRDEAGSALGISSTVLRKVGELGERNDPIHGRKTKGPRRPLNHEEIEWVEAALREIILQAAGARIAERLTMADLPPLP